MGIHGRYFLSREEEHFVSPDGWDFDIYSYTPKKFAFSKTELQLGCHVDIVRYNFLGRIRFRAIMKRPKLQFDFIDSYSTESSRLQSVNGVDSILMISVGGSYWEGVSDIGACGIEINFDEELTRQILAPNGDNGFHQRVESLIGGQSLVLPVETSALKMKQLVERYIAQVEPVKRETNPVELAIHLPRHSHEIQDIVLPTSEAEGCAGFDETLAEMARTILGVWSDRLDFTHHSSAPHRRMIALEIERLLWQSPLLREADQDVSLDELADRFKVSRRTIQLALQEHFGIGFIAFRRMIRMHQLRHAMIGNARLSKITILANEFYLGHMGRVSRDYAAMFGAKPSQERLLLRNIKRNITRFDEDHIYSFA